MKKLSQKKKRLISGIAISFLLTLSPFLVVFLNYEQPFPLYYILTPLVDIIFSVSFITALLVLYHTLYHYYSKDE